MVGFMDQRRNTNNRGIYGSRRAEIPQLVALVPLSHNSRGEEGHRFSNLYPKKTIFLVGSQTHTPKGEGTLLFRVLSKEKRDLFGPLNSHIQRRKDTAFPA